MGKSACGRHHGLCAFKGDETEPDRCPYCHTTGEAVVRCAGVCCRGSVWHHVRVHERADERAAVGAAKRRATRLFTWRPADAAREAARLRAEEARGAAVRG